MGKYIESNRKVIGCFNIIKKGGGMKKLLALISAVGLVAMMNGCGLNDPASKVDISITSIGPVAAGGGAAIVEGTIEADSIITNVDMTVLNSTDGDFKSNFTLYWTTGYTGKEKADLKVDMSTTVAAKSTTPSGTYKLKITGSSGGITTSSTKEFTVTSVGTPVTVATVEAGANKNTTLGSSIDLDEPKVMLMEESTTNLSTVDICYAYSGTDGTEKLFSPHHAKASAYTFTANWGTPNETKFYKTFLTPTQYDAITTKEQVQAEWSEPEIAATSIDCAKDDVFIAKTDQGAIVLMLITSQTPEATGKIDLKIAK
jgi:hypothetical protein